MHRLALATLVCGSVSLLAQTGAPSGSTAGNSSISGRGPGSDAFGGGATAYRNTVVVHGRVELENGQSAPADTVVELRCVGQAVMEEEVHTDGTFSFQFTAVSPESMTGPRTFGTTFGVAVSCQIQAMLNGYYSPQGVVAGQESMGMFDAGTLRLYKKHGEVTGMTVSATSLQAPKDARKSFQKGRQAVAKKKWKDALKQYERAVAAYPKYAEAWYELGRVREAQKKPAEARVSYEKAVEADSNYLPPVVRLALLDVRDNNWEQVAVRTGKVLKMNPFEFPEAYLYNVLANYQLDRLPEAEATARRALERNVQATYPQVVHVLGMVLAAQGRLEEAITEYERFFELAPKHPDRPAAEQQLAIIRQNL